MAGFLICHVDPLSLSILEGGLGGWEAPRAVFPRHTGLSHEPGAVVFRHSREAHWGCACHRPHGLPPDSLGLRVPILASAGFVQCSDGGQPVLLVSGFLCLTHKSSHSSYYCCSELRGVITMGIYTFFLDYLLSSLTGGFHIWTLVFIRFESSIWADWNDSWYRDGRYEE